MAGVGQVLCNSPDASAAFLQFSGSVAYGWGGAGVVYLTHLTPVPRFFSLAAPLRMTGVGQVLCNSPSAFLQFSCSIAYGWGGAGAVYLT